MEVQLQVRGMTCAHCEKAVKDALNNLNGVTHVEVHLEDNSVNVGYEKTVVSLEEICDVIEEQGYDVDR